LVIFSNCKINLGLRVVARRNDGYHDLETAFFPIPLYDALEIIEQPTSARDTISVTGLEIPGEHNTNLCLRALELLRSDFPSIPPSEIHLHKAIPIGAGLGGGSTNAAFTILLLNVKYNLALSAERLVSYAARLGSDCPFFILNTPCIGTGRGEILQKIDLSLVGFTLVLVNPGIHVSTSQAFKLIQPGSSSKNISDIIKMPIEKWKDELINDFEKPVFAQHPEIGSIKNRMYEQGAIYALMSGSGSSVFGLFEKNVSIDFGASQTWKFQL